MTPEILQAIQAIHAEHLPTVRSKAIFVVVSVATDGVLALDEDARFTQAENLSWALSTLGITAEEVQQAIAVCGLIKDVLERDGGS